MMLTFCLTGCLGDYPHTADENAPAGTYESQALDSNVFQSLNSPYVCDYGLPDYVTPPRR